MQCHLHSRAAPNRFERAGPVLPKNLDPRFMLSAKALASRC